MSEVVPVRAASVAMFLSPAGQRRVDFQAACGDLFGRLFLADGTEQATTLLGQRPIDLLIIDLAHFTRAPDLAPLLRLVSLRSGMQTLLICPFERATWLLELDAGGPCAYAIGALPDQHLRTQIGQLLDAAALAPMVHTQTLAGVLRDASAGWLAELGYQSAQVQGKPFDSFLAPASVSLLQAHLARVAQHGRIGKLALRLRRADASELDALLSAQPLLDARGLPNALRCELRALDQFARSPALLAELLTRDGELEALQALGARIRRAVQDVDDGAALAERVCRALCDYPGVLHAALFQVAGMGELTLTAQHAPRGTELARLLGGATQHASAPLARAFPGLLAAASGELVLLDTPERCGHAELARGLRALGMETVLGLPIPIDGGAPRGALCLMFERGHALSVPALAGLAELAQLAGFGLRMAEIQRESELMVGKLTHLSTADALTGTVNRRQGDELLEQETLRARRYGTALALIVFDIDRFKDINEAHGHPCGDMVLRTVADTVQAMLRTADLLVRSGGEEFTIIAPHTSAIDALRMAEKIRQTLAGTLMPGDASLTVSLGVAQLSELETAEALMLRVGAALFRAKRAGRNCVELAMQ